MINASCDVCFKVGNLNTIVALPKEMQTAVIEDICIDCRVAHSTYLRTVENDISKAWLEQRRLDNSEQSK